MLRVEPKKTNPFFRKDSFKHLYEPLRLPIRLDSHQEEYS